MKTKPEQKEARKVERHRQHLAITSVTIPVAASKQGQGESKSSPKVKRSEGLRMETDLVEQLDTLLNQSTRALNKNQEAEETDTTTLLK